VGLDAIIGLICYSDSQFSANHSRNITNNTVRDKILAIKLIVKSNANIKMNTTTKYFLSSLGDSGVEW
tara:strand:- start:413 stop:616 length:204 start_codon:yes stop_codon:yes gene_type:complete